MSLINIQNLTFSYDGGSSAVFDNVTFQIDTDWKLGFIGRNGRGKTTFLRLLTGEYEYRGSISASVKFDYFPYRVDDKTRLCYEILQEVCPTAEDWEILREFNCMQLDCDVLYRPFAELSGGEQTKALLCALFLNDGNLPLIDEPTNHLDSDARQAVSDYLDKKKGFILVSHDRAFLDGCIDHVLSINKSDIEIQSGNFSSWLTNFERKQAFEEMQNEKLKRDSERLSQSAERTSAWADKVEATKYNKRIAGLRPDRGYIGHKSAKMMKRAKVVEAKKQQAVEQKSALLKNTEVVYGLKLSPLYHHAKRIVAFSDVKIKYGGRTVCSPPNFEIFNGDRIALEGKNGCGKSSVLKSITGDEIEHEGTIYLASGLKISYVPQTTATLFGTPSEFAALSDIDESLFKTILRKMDFKIELFDRDISTYSEGQKKKILIAKSLCEKAHLYVWDEPLNYLDLYSRIQVENLIKEFKPTMLFVEHDKAFRRSVADKTIRL